MLEGERGIHDTRDDRSTTAVSLGCAVSSSIMSCDECWIHDTGVVTSVEGCKGDSRYKG